MSYLFYSIVILLVTLSVYRPFISKLDIAKCILLGGISFLIPFVVDYNANIYEDKRYISLIGFQNITTTAYKGGILSTPFDTAYQLQSFSFNYYSLIDAVVLSIITIFTVCICSFFTRWHFSIIFIKPRSNLFISGFLRHGISTIFILVAMFSHYSSCYSFSFVFTIIGLLWYVPGPYLVRRWRAITASTVISSTFCTFICYTAYTHSKLYTYGHTIWVLFVVVLVLLCNVLDFLDALLNTYPYLVHQDKDKQSQFQCATSLSYWNAVICLLFHIPSESDLNPAPIDDLEIAIRLLGPASRSWKTMAALFPVNLRQDLCLLYAFFRTADDLVDDASTPKQCEKNLITIRKFLRDVFFPSNLSSRQDNPYAADPTLPSHINWNYYASVLPNDDVLAVFRNFARICHYLCPRAMSELTNAWELDLRGEPVKKQKDLLNYAALISGTFGELCTCVIMYKTGHGNWGQYNKNNTVRNEEVLSRARATGQCLQLINIARDIIADSLVGRCYVPLQYMPYPPRSIYHLLKVAKNPLQVGEQTLKSFSTRILGLADQISDKAQKGIDGLPDEVQDSIRAAFEIYMAIGPTLREHPGFPLRAKVPKRQQQWIALRCIYGFRGPVARTISATFHKLVSMYFRIFTTLSNTRKSPITH
ncbi:Squalene/phytoene synthase-domain-containing protein [Cokeromyces recurvatus]|uniref:Squalene/phytoene synthase-domain-containing protein n=1 Tax=Cokeromyces recurvatus TaxID=90255 RepID=UPI0022203ED1|nr:Squalene/phytoene synthase-domain-containing protein [Cokeromyces recurvatus]KAI7897498.1 Squalene/phytoene synthase-domain-containing protein [Cokeromyces recurvatus]